MLGMEGFEFGAGSVFTRDESVQCRRHYTIFAMNASQRLVRLSLLLVVAVASAGCLRIETASPQRFVQPDATPSSREHDAVPSGSIWPVRWSDGEAMGAIVPIEGPLSAWAGVRLGADHFLRGDPDDRADAQAVARIAGAEEGYQYVLEGPGCFILQRSDDGRSARSTSSTPNEMFKFVSGREVREKQGFTVVKIERSWFAYYDATTDESRGLLVVAPGLFGVPEPVNDRFVEISQQHGWSVLRLLAPPSRFTEHTKFEIDRQDLSIAAQAIAHELGDRAAETAYAIEAGVQRVHALRPELAERQHVLVGMSGGAIAATTIATRTPDLYDAIVYIAGGSNFLMTNEESNYASWVKAIQFDWGNDIPDRAEREEFMAALNEAYLEHAHLDAYNLAPQMRDKKILMLHGSTDKAVPAQYGDQLWSRLGEPERWVFPVGHELLFITLNAQTVRVMRWLDEHLVEPDHSVDSEPEPKPDAASVTRP